MWFQNNETISLLMPSSSLNRLHRIFFGVINVRQNRIAYICFIASEKRSVESTKFERLHFYSLDRSTQKITSNELHRGKNHLRRNENITFFSGNHHFFSFFVFIISSYSMSELFIECRKIITIRWATFCIYFSSLINYVVHFTGVQKHNAHEPLKTTA